MDFRKGIENIGIRGGFVVLQSHFLSHFVNVVFIVKYCNCSDCCTLQDYGCLFSYRLCKPVVFHVV